MLNKLCVICKLYSLQNLQCIHTKTDIPLWVAIAVTWKQLSWTQALAHLILVKNDTWIPRLLTQKPVYFYYYFRLFIDQPTFSGATVLQVTHRFQKALCSISFTGQMPFLLFKQQHQIKALKGQEDQCELCVHVSVIFKCVHWNYAMH